MSRKALTLKKQSATTINRDEKIHGLLVLIEQSAIGRARDTCSDDDLDLLLAISDAASEVKTLIENGGR